MKARPLIPHVVSAAITVTAMALFLHTRVARQEAAATARQLAAEAEAMNSAPRHDDEAHGAATALRLPAAGAERAEAVERRLGRVRSMDNSLDQTRALLALIAQFGPGDFGPALDACPELPYGDRGPDFKAILKEWTQRDPLAALAHAGQDGYLRMQVLSTWCDQDPEAALSWVRTHEPDDAGLAGAVIADTSRLHPELALKHLAGLPAETRAETLRNMVNNNDDSSAKVALQWIGSIKDPEERAAAAKDTYQHWNSFDTLDQKFALFEHCPELLADERINNLFYCWSMRDDTAAADALEQLSPGKSRNEALDGLMGHLFSKGDEQAISTMLARFSGDLNDDVLGQWIMDHRGSNPQASLKHAALIQDPEARDQVIAAVLDGWATDAPEAAQDWLSRNEQPSRVRARLEVLAARPKDHSDQDRIDAVGR